MVVFLINIYIYIYIYLRTFVSFISLNKFMKGNNAYELNLYIGFRRIVSSILTSREE